MNKSRAIKRELDNYLSRKRNPGKLFSLFSFINKKEKDPPDIPMEKIQQLVGGFDVMGIEPQINPAPKPNDQASFEKSNVNLNNNMGSFSTKPPNSFMQEGAYQKPAEPKEDLKDAGDLIRISKVILENLPQSEKDKIENSQYYARLLRLVE